MKKHLWSLLTRLVDSYCDQTQMLGGTLEPFCDLGPLLAGGEVDMGRQNEKGGICVDPISGPSVLTACHKFQAETKSVKANISCFQFVPLQNVCFYPCLSSRCCCRCEFLLISLWWAWGILCHETDSVQSEKTQSRHAMFRQYMLHGCISTRSTYRRTLASFRSTETSYPQEIGMVDEWNFFR